MKLVILVALAGCWTGAPRDLPGTTPAGPSLETKAAHAHATNTSYLDITPPDAAPVSLAILGVMSGGPATNALTPTFDQALLARARADRARFHVIATPPPLSPPCPLLVMTCLQRAADQSEADVLLAGSVHQMSWEHAPTFELRLMRAHATMPSRLANITVAPGETLDAAVGRAFDEVTHASAYFVVSANVPAGTVTIDGDTRAPLVDGHAKILVLDSAPHVVEVSAPGHRHAVRSVRAAPGETLVVAVLR